MCRHPQHFMPGSQKRLSAILQESHCFQATVSTINIIPGCFSKLSFAFASGFQLLLSIILLLKILVTDAVGFLTFLPIFSQFLYWFYLQLLLFSLGVCQWECPAQCLSDFVHICTYFFLQCTYSPASSSHGSPGLFFNKVLQHSKWPPLKAEVLKQTQISYPCPHWSEVGNDFLLLTVHGLIHPLFYFYFYFLKPFCQP